MRTELCSGLESESVMICSIYALKMISDILEQEQWGRGKVRRVDNELS